MAINISLDHKLTGLPNGDFVYQQTPNLYKQPEFRAGYPDSIVIHYTGMNDAVAAANLLCDEDHKASAHLVVGKDGKVYQLAPFNYRTWHAGESEYKGRKYYNHYSIGIEIDNLGWLEKQANGSYSRTKLLPYKIARKQAEVVEATHWNPKVRHQYWDEYTKAQLDRVTEICQALMQVYAIHEVLGHDEISPERKQDPGPAYPMEALRKELFSADRSQAGDEREVLVSRLNIRDAPDVAGGLVAKPLPMGTRVKVKEEHDGWCRVETTVEGWVAKQYLS